MSATVLALSAAAALAAPLARPTSGDEPAPAGERTGAAAHVLSLVDEVEPEPWNTLSETRWAQMAEELLEAGATGRQGLTPADTVRWLGQLGRAAEYGNQDATPYYGEVQGRVVNLAWAVATCIAAEDPNGEALLAMGDRGLEESLQLLYRQRETLCRLSVERLFVDPSSPQEQARRRFDDVLGIDRYLPVEDLPAGAWASTARSLRDTRQQVEDVSEAEEFRYELVLGRAVAASDLSGKPWFFETDGGVLNTYVERAACRAQGRDDLVVGVPKSLKEVLDTAEGGPCEALLAIP